MGNGTRPGSLGHTIATFHPDDTDDTMYIADGVDGATLKEKICEKWPDIKVDELRLTPEYIHTDCLGYDLYDPGDYTNFLKIEASADYFARMKK